MQAEKELNTNQYFTGEKQTIQLKSTQMKKIYLSSDHGGFELKLKVIEYLIENNYDAEDLGCENTESCDYPTFGAAVGEKVVANPETIGITICGSGIGISMAANKIKGARCAMANSKELAKLGRKHNGANILALGARTKFIDPPLKIVEEFLATQVDPDQRHVRRRGMLDQL